MNALINIMNQGVKEDVERRNRRKEGLKVSLCVINPFNNQLSTLNKVDQKDNNS